MPTPAGTQQGRESSAPPDWNQHLEGRSWEVPEPHPVMYSWVQFLLAPRHRSPETTPQHSSHVSTSQEQSWARELVPAEIPPWSTAQVEGQCRTQHRDLAIYVPVQFMSFSTKPSLGG